MGGGGGGGISGQPGNSTGNTNGRLGEGGGSDSANGNTAGSGAGFQGNGQQGMTSANGKDWTNGLTGGGSVTGKGGFGGGGGATGGISGHHYVINGGFGNGGSPEGNYSSESIISAAVNTGDGNGYFDLTLESVPKPSTYALAGIGVVALAVSYRRRRV